MAPGRKPKNGAAASAPAATGSASASAAKPAAARKAPAASTSAKPKAVARSASSTSSASSAAGSDVTPAAADALAAFRAQLGNAPDAEVAALAGVKVDQVKAYRREQDIPPFHRAPPSRTGTASAESPAAARGKASDSDQVVRRRRAGAVNEVVVRTPAAEPAVTQPAPTTQPAPKKAAVTQAAPVEAANPLEAFRDQLGKVADHVIADQANVDRTVVGAWRRKLGVAPYDGFRKRKSGDVTAPPAATSGAKAAASSKAAVAAKPPAAKPAEAKATTPSQTIKAAAKGKPGRRSAIDAFFDIVGKLTDAEVAAKAKVSVPAVTQYRIRRGIPAAGRAPAAAKSIPASKRAAVANAAPAVMAASSGEASKEVRHRRSKLDAHAHLVGVLSDSEVALLANVSSEGVRQYRRRHGITAAGVRTQAEESAPATVTGAAPSKAVVTPVVAPAAAPVAAPVAAPSVASAAVASGAVAYSVVAHAGDESRRFIAIGQDIREALGRAVTALDARADGPWVIQSVRRLGDALG